jgi:hypothetical protein
MKNMGHRALYQHMQRQDDELRKGVGSLEFISRRCSMSGMIPELRG